MLLLQNGFGNSIFPTNLKFKTMSSNIQQGLSDLLFAGTLTVGFLLCTILISGVYKIASLVLFKIRMKLEINKDRLRSMGLKR